MGRACHSRQPSRKPADPPSITQSRTPPAHNISISPTSTDPLLHVGFVNAPTQSPHDLQLKSSQPTSTTFTSHELTNSPAANKSLSIASPTATNLPSHTTSSLLSLSSNGQSVSSKSSTSSGGPTPSQSSIPLSASMPPQSATRGPGSNDPLSSTRAPTVNSSLSGFSTRTSVPTAASSTPISSTPNSNANIHIDTAAIIVPVFVFTGIIIALAIPYFIRRRRRQRKVAAINPLWPTNSRPEANSEIRVASLLGDSTMMNSGIMAPDAATINGQPSEPNRFASPQNSPVRNDPDAYTLSRPTPELKHPDAVTKTAAVPSPAPSSSSHASSSFKVPFFHHLKALRRRGELRMTPAIEQRGIEYSISEATSTRLTDNEPEVHVHAERYSGSEYASSVFAI